MRIALILLMALHGLIHLLGFFKAFHILEVKELTMPIGRLAGGFWLLAAILLLSATALFALQHKWFWIVALVGVVVSQALVILYWQDARFGTLANVIMLVAAILAFGTHQFTRQVAAEQAQLLDVPDPRPEQVIRAADLERLPVPVQRWLERAGVVGQPIPRIVYLEQTLKMKLQPSDTGWREATAHQYFNTVEPGFLWRVKMPMFAGLGIEGRDFYYQGEGSMQMKVAALIPVANAGPDPRINEGAMLRYLAEIIWFPAAALRPYLRWEAIDERRARAIFHHGGLRGEGIFTFTKEGDFQQFSAHRYYGGEPDAQRYLWVCTADEVSELGGCRIPTRAHVSWHLRDGVWTWLELEVTHLRPN
jgi:hypothetical protein